MSKRTIMMAALSGLVLVGAAALPCPAESQDMIPLADYLMLPEDSQEPTYPLIRCSGFYVAMTKYIGANRLTDEQIDNLINSTAAMMFWASQMRQATGVPEDVATAAVKRDMENVAAAYRARMDQNYATTGAAFANDPLINSDAPICKAWAEDAREALN